MAKGYINGIPMRPPSRKGAKHTEQAKQKNRDKHIGKRMTEVTRQKMMLVNWIVPNKGRFVEGHKIKNELTLI